jgi:hypothetical protein
MNEKQLRAAADAAKSIRVMTDALKSEGFNEAQAVALVSAMLSGAQVYIPLPTYEPVNKQFH